jgi:hypothetical protein
MAMHELKRTHYEDAGDTAIRHDTRDHRQDMVHYHVPLMQMHQAGLHGWGIAVGLQVTQTGPSAVTVAEGLAIDARGRMLALAAQGHRPGQPGQAFVHTTGQPVEVPVVMGLEGVADGVYYLTIALATTFISPGEPVEGRWLPQEQRIVNTPILTLQPQAGFAPDGMAVILATVTLAAGVVTQLSGAERQLVTLATGALVVRRGGEGDDAPESGRIGPLAAGGLALEVPEAGDQVVVQRAGGQPFQGLTVRAERLRLVDGAEREVLHVDAAQATLRLGAAGQPGTLVVQDATGTEVLRVDAAQGALHLSGDLDVAGNIRGQLASGLVSGQGRPPLSLREVLNTLLRGELPGSPEAPSGPEENILSMRRGTFFDAANGLIRTWGRSNLIGLWQIFAARLSLVMPEAGFSPVQQITGPSGSFHHAILLDTGEALIIYETELTGEPNIVMKRGLLDTLNPNSPAITVTGTAAMERFPFAVAVGGQVLIFWHENSGNTWQFKRYDVANGSFSESHRLADIATTAEGELHAAVDSTNTVWVAFTTHSANQHGSQIQVIAVPPGGLPGQPQSLTAPTDHNRDPFIMVDNRDNVWVFWYDTSQDDTSSTGSIWYRRFLRATMAWETVGGTELPGTSGGAVHASFSAASDAEGGIWLFWVRSTPSAANIWYTAHNPVAQTWSEPWQVTRHPGTESGPFVLRGPDDLFWLFWRRLVNPGLGISQPFYRRIFSSI